MKCIRCNGTGQLPDAPEKHCEAAITIAHEAITCYASKPHPGQPHMAILCEPCKECQGYDEHTASCSMGNFTTDQSDWWLWNDGDRRVTRAEPMDGLIWSRRFGPNADRVSA